MSTLEKVAIGLAVTLGGAVLMALEVAAFRIIGKTFGTALTETTTVIAVFLAAMSIGYYLGGRVVDGRPQMSTLAWTLVLAAPPMLAVVQFDAFLTESIGRSAIAPSLHTLVATTVLFAIPTTLLAAISPIAVRLLSHGTMHSGRVAGAVSAMSTAGSIAGTVVTAFVLIDVIGSIRITVVLLAATSLVLALCLGLSSVSRVRTSGTPIWARGPVVVGVVSGVLIGALTLDRIGARSVVRTSDRARVLFERDTPYHRVRVIERPPGIRDLFIDATLQSIMRLDQADLRGLEYEEYKHFAKIARPGIKRVLAIGLGGGTSARQFTEYYPDVTFEAVEIDPVVADAAQKYFGVQPGERLRIHIGDGRTFVRKSSQRYDMISVDAYTRGRYGSTIPPHLVTKEFFEEVSKRLEDNGIVHFHSYAGRNSLFSRAVYKTMASVFPSVVILGQTEIIASAAPLHVEPEDILSRTASIRRHLPDIDRRLATLQTQPPEVRDVPLLTDDFAPVDTLLRGGR
ncbi:MAG TPA: fused MFS/spermidine synthase [Thermoanaerobaculia bacterium]|nr:fused MFS/spermidine synthase [Thermoanaerobaculia bacterium]